MKEYLGRYINVILTQRASCVGNVYIMITPTEEGTLPKFLNKYLQFEGEPVLGRGLWALRSPVGPLGNALVEGQGAMPPEALGF